MNRISGCQNFVRRHVWGKENRKNCAESVPREAKKCFWTIWNSNRQTVLLQERLKKRFSKASIDSSPIVLKESKTVCEEQKRREKMVNNRHNTVWNEQQNWRSGPKGDITAKNMPLERPKLPESFFVMPNFAQQKLDKLIRGHLNFWEDWSFFYVDLKQPTNCNKETQNYSQRFVL